MKNIDWKRFSNGSRQIDVDGVADTPNRKALIQEAIILIQKDPETALKDGYLGFKQYDRFGDQRCDCEYGMGPRHGSIVFRIGRDRGIDTLDAPEDAVYFLKCFRDAPGREYQQRDGVYQYKREANIQDTWNEMRDLEGKSAKLQEWLDPIKVDEFEEEIVAR